MSALSTVGDRKSTRRKFLIFLLFFVPFVILGIVYVFEDFLLPFYGQDNYVAIHLVLELISVIVSFNIAIQAWLVYPFVLRGRGIQIGAVFLSIGFLDLFHTITFPGMPFFLAESSAHLSTWFWIVARLTLAVFFISLILTSRKRRSFPRKQHLFNNRYFLYVASIIFSSLWVFVIYSFSTHLPVLFHQGIGTTPLYNSLELFVIAMHAVLIVGLFMRKKPMDELDLTLVLSLFYLIISSWLFIKHTDVHDPINFFGHLLKALGFYFLSYSLYATSVKRPFQLQRSLQKQLEHHAYFDEVTNLPNLRHLNDELLKLINSRRSFGIILFDIHQLQKISNSLGQTFTDDILKIIAKRLQQSLPKQYFIARLTGDQMAVLMINVREENDLLAVSQQVSAVFEKPFKTRNFELMMNITLGMTIFPKDGNKPDLLLDNAKAALDEAKLKAAPYLFYRPEMRTKQYTNLVLENDLRKAIENDELFLVYQPKIDMTTGEITGFEALLRWEHPKRGFISPGIFIPIAEETGLIVPIGDWVIRKASEQLKEWHALDPTLKMAVNFSFRQFYQPDLTIKIQNMLEDAELNSSFLELELTESMAIEIDVSIEKIKRLKELGVRISIDDFGTGYSSLSYLKELPIDKLKIDQSFIRGLHLNEQDNMIVSTIISIAQNLKVEVIAEGVEEIEQLLILQQKQCNHVQGYLFSKPQTAEYITENFRKLQSEARKYFAI